MGSAAEVPVIWTVLYTIWAGTVFAIFFGLVAILTVFWVS